MTSVALADALLRMLYADTDEQALEWARRVVRIRHQGGEYPLVSMLDDELIDSLACVEMRRRRQ